MIKNVRGVPAFEVHEYAKKRTPYCLMIPIINEGARIQSELKRIYQSGVAQLCDVILLDGGSTDGSLDADFLRVCGVSALLIKRGPGRQGAQLRMGFYWSLARGYTGFVTVDGNDKDSVERTPDFIKKLDEGYAFVQGSRYIPGGAAIRTPLSRHLAVKYIHAPIISKTAGYKFTDTTNAFRAYAKDYITHPQVDIFRDVFSGYELLAYLSVRASQLGLRVCEVPVTRTYPEKGKTPTKIHPIKGNVSLLRILLKNMRGDYNPVRQEENA
jgi:hypothetical protein